MPIEGTIDELKEIQKNHICKECGKRLYIYYDSENKTHYLACDKYLTSQHEGIMRLTGRWEREGISSLLISEQRRIMEENYTGQSAALQKYIGVVSLSKEQAREIVKLCYPDAPEQQVARAVAICASYGLNPLLHVFLIPFKNVKEGRVDWACVIGIKAKRLLASRRGLYSYVDGTPRVMTEKEQGETFGEVFRDRIWVKTVLRDPETGAEGVGYGWWPKEKEVMGGDKGNTKFNMASIRSESQALDRLRPGEMPVNIDVIPDEYSPKEGEVIIEGESYEIGVDPAYPEAKPEHFCKIHQCEFKKMKKGNQTWYAHKTSEGKWCNEGQEIKKESGEEEKPESQPGEPLPRSESKQEQKSPADPSTDIWALINWCLTHGKQYDHNWVCKEGNVAKPEEITDVARLYADIKAVTGWE